MTEFYPFFLALFAGVFFSMLSRRTHIPWVVALIIGGIILGPNAFNLLTINPTIEFIGQIGLIFLMFMAGLETKFSNFNGFGGKLFLLAFINGAVPFVIGVGIGMALGYGLMTSLVLGVVFISSSIAVVIPSLETHKLLHTQLGQSVIMTTVIQDVASLIVLSLILQNVSPVTSLPLYLFYPLLLVALISLRFFIPKIRDFFVQIVDGRPDLFQLEFRSTFLILIGTVMVFELLGLHPIVAGFFSGLILAGSIKTPALKEKIRTISYGIFIPTFFIVMGLQTDITIFSEVSGAWMVVTFVVLGSVISKFVSGWMAGKMVGFSRDEALLFAITSIPQLSTTLATGFAAFALGLIDQVLLTSLVTLSVITVLVSPLLMNILGERISRAAGV
ncbi:MAG: cation:proton antiporter [Candidatus Pacebacteria bacterium]|nr:cation:proton antiporter [Candidatus Paceibacterota bacterium]MCF7857177.1 cation:proton antiporter [Candidatus Paceibacterota bacterium]